MCQVGDIILIYNAKNNKRFVGKHPFLVLSDKDGIVAGIYRYDFIGLLLTSADTDEKKEQRNRDGNFPIAKEDKIPITNTSKNAYIEANQFFYFDKSKIKYRKIGQLDSDIFNLVVEYIEELSGQGIEITQILDKANKIENGIEDGE